MNTIFSFINNGSGYELPSIPGLTPLFQGDPGNLPKQYVSGIDQYGAFVLTTDPTKAVNGAVVGGGSARPTDQIQYKDAQGNIYQYANSPGVNGYSAGPTAYLQLVSGPGLTDPSKLPTGGFNQTPDQIYASGTYRDLGNIPVGQSLNSYAVTTKQFDPTSGPVVNGQAVGTDFSTNPGSGTGFTAGGVNYGTIPTDTTGNRILSSSTSTAPAATLPQLSGSSLPTIGGLQAPDLTQIQPGQPFNYGGLQYVKDASGNITPYIGGQQSLSAGTGTIGQVGGVDVSSLPPDQQALLQQLQGFLTKLQQNGQAINPNIQITPEQAAQFMTQASNEIDPYYQSQLKTAKDQFLTSIGYSENQIANNEAIAQRDYALNLRSLGESAADQGFAQSGRRIEGEQNLALNTQNSINQARSAFTYGAQNAASAFASQYGTQNVPSLSFGSAPRVLAGNSAFDTSGSPSPVYSLSNDVYNGLTGSQQYQEQVDIRNRAAQLGQASLQQQATQQQRTLTI